MPAVVYVAGISGAIHFGNYYRDSVTEHGVEGAPTRALKHAFLPCMLATGTTAAGLASLYTSELVPIQMFGVYSAAGVVATLGLLFLFLPSWMQLWPMKPHSLLDGSQPKAEDIALPVRVRKILERVLDHHRLVFVTLLAFMVVGLVGLTKINTSIKLMNLFSADAPIIHDYQWLESRLGPLVPMEVIVRIDNDDAKLTFLERMELIQRIQAQMVQIHDIGCTMSATTFAPSLEVKRRGPLVSKAMMRTGLNRKLEDHRDEYLDSDFVSLEPDGTELWRISARVGALNDVDYGVFKDEIRARVEPVLRQERERIIAERKKIAQREAKREAEAGGLPPVDAEPKSEQVVQANSNLGIDAVYTGLVPVVYKAQREMLNGLAWNFMTDLATITAVMIVVFWDVSAGFILLIPSAFPMVMVFGMMGWLGVVIDVGTIMTPVVALSVSVDDVMHFLIWYRRGLADGMSRRESIMLAYEGCARAMYQSWAVLGLGLAVFALSSFVPTQRFGAMTFLLLTCALVANLLLLPAVLASPLSYFFGRRVVREAAKKRAAAKAEPSANGGPRPTIRQDSSHRVRN
jgi:predicted RND superfamily exporter protein